MSSKAPPSDLPTLPFASAREFEAFLEREHKTNPGFYLKLAKKSSGIPSVSADEAVEIALCFGWINGWGKGLDDDWYVARYTPRRARSLWSLKNVETVGRLMQNGQMRPEGIAAVDSAKSDGRWERAYAGPATITVPDDLRDALAAHSKARTFFETLNKTDRYSVLWRVQTSSPQNRANRVQTLVQMLAQGRLAGAATKWKGNSALKSGTKKRVSGKTPVKVAPAKKLTKISRSEINDPSTRPRRSGLRPRT